jgi:hypothetical protein
LALLADDGQLSGEALLAQCLGGAQAGQRGADDDDPAILEITGQASSIEGFRKASRKRALRALIAVGRLES